uniref:Uncharacterized protein n=1 Tax=Chromera velia CCMP2878 TaxID=1169474 RepID=A0A0G4HEV4_9ALVE|eukprot:Cvel_6595.t1-p1 / transcript=Cvel_6595.t1 / gene=Cvel_6595 / organism=Chromera_velia_CCMP2878 / gene_product=hypothetical protein / transcript_product=hypothetical protein / location=Cvel_scaffold326:6204-15725(+) / protein_length=491 / sequence_SO=supercontig / SO=protein_coding / is_pseudo=false
MTGLLAHRVLGGLRVGVWKWQRSPVPRACGTKESWEWERACVALPIPLIFTELSSDMSSERGGTGAREGLYVRKSQSWEPQGQPPGVGSDQLSNETVLSGTSGSGAEKGSEGHEPPLWFLLSSGGISASLRGFGELADGVIPVEKKRAGDRKKTSQDEEGGDGDEQPETETVGMHVSVVLPGVGTFVPSDCMWEPLSGVRAPHLLGQARVDRPWWEEGGDGWGVSPSPSPPPLSFLQVEGEGEDREVGGSGERVDVEPDDVHVRIEFQNLASVRVPAMDGFLSPGVTIVTAPSSLSSSSSSSTDLQAEKTERKNTVSAKVDAEQFVVGFRCGRGCRGIQGMEGRIGEAEGRVVGVLYPDSLLRRGKEPAPLSEAEKEGASAAAALPREASLPSPSPETTAPSPEPALLSASGGAGGWMEQTDTSGLPDAEKGKVIPSIELVLPHIAMVRFATASVEPSLAGPQSTASGSLKSVLSFGLPGLGIVSCGPGKE